MTLAIVTTTHDRPLCFSLLEKWVANQTLQPDLWLVINDSERPEDYTYTMGEKVIARTDEGLTEQERSLPSICKNWLEAIKHLGEADRVGVFEDDDYYDPRALSVLNDLLDEAELAGISHDVYFKLPSRRFQRMHNDHHASLAATAFRSSVLPHVEHVCRMERSVFIDMYLWLEPVSKKLLPQPLEDGRMLHVGLKGMPGAKGLGMGHQNMHSGSTDPTFATLQQWIGPEAAGVYRRFWLEHFG